MASHDHAGSLGFACYLLLKIFDDVCFQSTILHRKLKGQNPFVDRHRNEGKCLPFYRTQIICTSWHYSTPVLQGTSLEALLPALVILEDRSPTNTDQQGLSMTQCTLAGGPETRAAITYASDTVLPQPLSPSFPPSALCVRSARRIDHS